MSAGKGSIVRERVVVLRTLLAVVALTSTFALAVIHDIQRTELHPKLISQGAKRPARPARPLMTMLNMIPREQAIVRSRGRSLRNKKRKRRQ